MWIDVGFSSFFAGGFECSTHRRHDGRRLDLIEATGHDRHARRDYEALQARGVRTVRDGLRWHLIENAEGRYDWRSFLPMLQASQAAQVQPIWDLCHYGWPDHIDMWRPLFVKRFAEFAAAVATFVREHSDLVPTYCPVNEISFWAWAGGDEASINPLAHERGMELKHQLIRASLAAIDAIRAVEPRARFMQAEPVVNVIARTAAEAHEANAQSRAVFDSWLMLAGELWPGLGGEPSSLDIVGVNFYPDNQWFLDRETVPRGHPRYRPFRDLLADTYRLLQRPLFIAETGAEGLPRAEWLRYVCDDVAAARAEGIPVLGICLYPILDYPGWSNERHCETGLFGFLDAQGHRPVCEALDQELMRQQIRFGESRL